MTNQSDHAGIRAGARAGFFCALLLLAAPAVPGAPNSDAPWTDPDRIDLQMDISQLGSEQLRLLHHAVLARHCFYFEDAHVRAEFRQYQQDHCGYGYVLGDRPLAAADVHLAPAESVFVSRLQAREAQLRSGGIRQEGAGFAFDLRAVVNRSQFTQLGDSVWARLARDGCVALPGEHEQLYHVYEANAYHLVPNFITTDAILQLHHLYFDYTLRTVEQESLLPGVRRLCKTLAQRFRARYEAASADSLAPVLLTAAQYFAIAAALAAGDTTGTPPVWLPAAGATDYAAQWDLIHDADRKQFGPLLGTVDYTLFKPRGHYTRTAPLQDYFRVMTWLGLPGFVLEEGTAPIALPLLIVHELTRDTALWQAWQAIDEPIRFYVGPTDDITPTLVLEVARELCGDGAPLADWLGRREEIRRLLIARDPTRIRPQAPDDRRLPQVRFLGLRYIPDSEIFQKLTDWQQRRFPTGLDVFAVMQVPLAEQVLRSQPIAWAPYWPTVDTLRKQLGDWQPREDEDNLYRRWLRLLRTLNQPAPAGAPAAVRGPAWAAKNLQTGLASWAELRHDTILYAKQSAAECGGDERPHRLVGYVEPRPDVWREMLALQRFTLDQLARRSLLGTSLRGLGAQIGELLEFLALVSEKEIAGEALSNQELDKIASFGGELEFLTLGLLMDGLGQWYDVTGPDRLVAVVADVHTAGGTVLEAGVGLGDELYVLVEIDGGLYLTRGAVFSYYEFPWPANDRLTDEQWQRMLHEGRAPERPPWTERLLLPEPAPPLPARYRYSSGC